MSEQDWLAEFKVKQVRSRTDPNSITRAQLLMELGQEAVPLLVAEVERLRDELATMRREYDREHHGMGVPGSDFHRFGGSYHDKDGNPL